MSTKPHRQTIGKQLIIETHADEVKIICTWHEMRPEGTIQTLQRIVAIGLVMFISNFLTFLPVMVLVAIIATGIGVDQDEALRIFFVYAAPIINVGIFYILLATQFNATVIKIDRQSLTTKPAPLPWLGYKQFNLSTLKQLLYSQEKLHHDKNSEFALYLTTANLKPYKLLDNLSVEQAQAVAEVVEQVVVGHGQQMIPYIRREVKGVKGVTVKVSEKRLQIVSRWRRINSLGGGCMLIAFAVLLDCFMIFLAVFSLVGVLNGEFSNWIAEADSWFGALSKIVCLGGGGALLVGAGIIFFSIVLYELVAQYVNKSSIQIDPNTFVVKNGPIPFIKSKQFDPTDIKQLYSKQRIVFSSKGDKLYTYDLYLISQDNQHHKLLTMPYPEQVSYLEQTIEEYLGLASQSVTGEVGTGSLGQQRLVFATWQQLAETHHLEFSSLANWGKMHGIYRGHRLNLESFQGADEIISTRLKVTASQTSTAIDPLSANELATLFPPDRFTSAIGEQLRVEDNGQTLTYTQERFVSELEFLQSMFDNLCDLLEAFPSVIATGGQAAPTLLTIAEQKAHLLHAVSIYLLVAIAQETTHRLKPNVDQLVCPDCLTYCAAHPIQNPTLKIDPYYGCRNCRQSREFLEIADQIVVVLDREMTVDTVRHGDNLRVNWLTQRQVGDFARIEIIQATDEEVERFIVQAANDTDPVRQPRYRTMACVVSPGCSLSENTLRILRGTFVVEGEMS